MQQEISFNNFTSSNYQVQDLLIPDEPDEAKQEHATQQECAENPNPEEKEHAAKENDDAKNKKSRKLMSTATAVEPWLLERFPLDPKDVVVVHVVHKTSMLPHFQIRLTSNASHDGKILGLTEGNYFA